MAYEKTFEKIFNALFPLLLLGLLIHWFLFIFRWIVKGSEETKYQGLMGAIRYYFYTWNWVFITVKDIYEQKETEKESNKE